jgi:mRNA interferase MazF
VATRYPVKIQAAPKVGALYWCSLPPENTIHLPEFWKKRPVVVISRKNTLRGKVVVLPITTDDDNEAHENSIELSQSECDKINGKRCWVVCDHPMTVATSRLDYVRRNPPRIATEELAVILDACHSLLAGWRTSITTVVAVEEMTTVVETTQDFGTTVTDALPVKAEDKVAE